jgi:hypothetical protein
MTDDETMYRIEYTIQRQRPGEDDFTDIGFGSSGEWNDIDQAAHIAISAIQNDEWETEPGMPDPKEARL